MRVTGSQAKIVKMASRTVCLANSSLPIKKGESEIARKEQQDIVLWASTIKAQGKMPQAHTTLITSPVHC